MQIVPKLYLFSARAVPIFVSSNGKKVEKQTEKIKAADSNERISIYEKRLTTTNVIIPRT
jgi:hypothetical protein